LAAREGHREIVYSTPRNPEKHAEMLEKAVLKCAHVKA
jgi:hypothetical protein